jgi:ABC-type oligopeptide transport system substrate-binding subunit
MKIYTNVPESLDGKTTPPYFYAFWMCFCIQWSKDESRWQYKHREDYKWFESDVYTKDVQPSDEHFSAWILSTIGEE